MMKVKNGFKITGNQIAAVGRRGRTRFCIGVEGINSAKYYVTVKSPWSLVRQRLSKDLKHIFVVVEIKDRTLTFGETGEIEVTVDSDGTTATDPVEVVLVEDDDDGEIIAKV